MQFEELCEDCKLEVNGEADRRKNGDAEQGDHKGVAQD